MSKKKTEAERVKAYIKRILDVNGPRSLKDPALIQIINHFNNKIVDAWWTATNKIDELK